MPKLPEGVYLRRGTRLWIRYAVRGRKYREPVDTTDPREAARIRRRRIEAHERGERTPHSDSLRVTDVLQAVLRDYELNDRRSIDTARSYVRTLEAARLGDGGGRSAVPSRRDHDRRPRDDPAPLAARRARERNHNRRCNLLRRGFRLMVRAKKLHVVPYIPRLTDRSPRGRYIAPADLARIQASLPPHLRNLVAFAYDDGIRKGQLARTQRRFVDLARGVIEWPAEECKRERPHVVPLEPGGTLEVVTRLMAEGRKRLWCPYLFHGAHCAAGRRASKRYGCVGDFKKAWTTACERAGFPVGRKHGGFVFHHTRNSAVTNLVAAGVAEGDAMKVTGHQTAHVFRHYDLGDVDALRARLAQRQAYVAAQPTQASVARLAARRRT